MKIIPAIDIIDGKCVRLTRGDFNTSKVYGDEPLEIAKKFEDHGIQYLHLVDLDGARSGKIINHKALHNIATQTSLHIDFGGGVKSDKDLEIAFESGAKQVTAGSIAVNDPQKVISWIKEFDQDRIILGADCKNGMIATHGWKDITQQEVISFIRQYQKKGINTVICTDIGKDGMMEGPATKLYTDILKDCDINLIASGGVTTIEDVKMMQKIGCAGAIVGKAIYEGRITLEQIQEFVLNEHIN